MRAAAVALFLCGCAALLHASEFEARSKHLALAIDAHTTAAGVEYHVVVRDLDANKAILDRHPHALAGGRVTVWSEVGDLFVMVRITPRAAGLIAMAVVERNYAVIEQIAAAWSFTPRNVFLPDRGPFRVGGDVTAPGIVDRVDPVYPPLALRARIAGVVILQVLVDQAGIVRIATVLKPLPFGLSEAAVDAVKQWTFLPATLHGQPVEVLFDVTVNCTPPEPR